MSPHRKSKAAPKTTTAPKTTAKPKVAPNVTAKPVPKTASYVPPKATPTPTPKTPKEYADAIQKSGGKALPGCRGNTTFSNDGRGKGQKLPDKTTYKEYDVNKFVKGVNRGAERIVIGADGTRWHTTDHYKTFTQI